MASGDGAGAQFPVCMSSLPYFYEFPCVAEFGVSARDSAALEDLFRIRRFVQRRSGRPETTNSPSAPQPTETLWIVLRSFEIRLTRELSAAAQESIQRTPGSASSCWM